MYEVKDKVLSEGATIDKTLLVGGPVLELLLVDEA